MASVIVLARLLTPTDFGIVTMVTTFNLLFRSWGLNGFTELIMQREELSESLASNLFWVNLGIGTLLTVVFAASGRLMALFFNNSAVTPVAAGMSLTIFLGCLAYIHLALLQRAMHFRTVALINFIGAAAYVLFCILFALAGLHYWALVWGCVAQYLLIAILSWSMCQWVPRLPSRKSDTSAGVMFAFNVYLHFGFNYLTRNTDNLLVGYKFGAQVLGFYKRAYDLFVLAATQLLSPLSSVAVGVLSRVSSDREQFERYFLRALSLLAFVGMGVGADFCLIGRDFIRVLLGPQWDEAGKIFTLFGPGIGVMLLYNTHGWIHLAIGRPERWFRWGLIEFACTGSLFLMMLHWGPSGIAFAWTASFFILMLPGLWYAGKPIELNVWRMVSLVWKYFAASSGAALLTFAVVRNFHTPVALEGGPAAALRLVVTTAVFLVLYLLAVVVLHRGTKPIAETIAMLKYLVPSRSQAILNTPVQQVDTAVSTLD